MHVIQSIPSLIPESGGPARSVTSLCDALAALETQVQLLSLDVGDAFGKPLLPTHSQVQVEFVRNRFAIGLRQLWAPTFRKRLSSLVDERQIDLIHDHCIWLPTNTAAAAVAKRQRIPFVISLRGMLEPWALQYGRRHKQLAWWLYQKRILGQARLLHATSTSEAENLRKLGLDNPIAIVPNGVTVPDNSGIIQLRQNIDVRTLLFMSRIHPKKGLLNLVKALAMLDLTNWQVIIAGPDENQHRREVETLIQTYQLQHKFTFLGPVDDNNKWDIYQTADLFVLPTFSENFGIVVAEALAAGVPVITTKGTPWQELETHSCGWWIEIGVEPLAEALQQAMNLTDSERARMGKNGRQLIEEKYSWQSVGQDMLSAYHWVLQGGAAPEFVHY